MSLHACHMLQLLQTKASTKAFTRQQGCAPGHLQPRVLTIVPASQGHRAVRLADLLVKAAAAEQGRAEAVLRRWAAVRKVRQE